MIILAQFVGHLAKFEGSTANDVKFIAVTN